jgi:hypothetical protein
MAVRPAEGQVIRETKTTTIEPAEEQRSGKKHPPMWDFIESLTPDQWNSKDYEIILYRGTKFDRGEYCAKYFEAIDFDRIKNDFGGGKYNILMKVPPGKQLRYNEDCSIAGLPKENPQTAHAMPTDATSQLLFMFREELKSLREELRASRGGDLGLEAVKQALQLNGTVFSSAATAATGTLERLANGSSGSHAAGPMDDIMKQFMAAAIAKMLNPADPIENFTKMASAMGALGFKMNPMGSGGGEKLTDKLVMGLVNQLPTLTQHFGSIMDGYRRAEEAKAAAAAYARGVQPPINVQPIQQPPAPAALNNVIAMPAPQPEAAAPPANGQPSPDQLAQAEQMMQYIEQKIVEILSNQALTPEEAAAQALTFIDVTDPVSQHPNGRNLIDEILQHGKMGLDYIFSNREILKRVPKDDRLEAFKNAFLEGARPVTGPADLKPDPNTPPA